VNTVSGTHEVTTRGLAQEVGHKGGLITRGRSQEVEHKRRNTRRIPEDERRTARDAAEEVDHIRVNSMGGTHEV